MRILVAHPGPSFSVHDVYVGWVEALEELGQTVVGFNLDERLTFYSAVLMEVGRGKFRKALDVEAVKELAVNGLYAALYKVRPHVLIVVSGFFIPTDVLQRARSYGTKVVMIHTESPYEDDRQLSLAAHADLNLINDPTNLGLFNEVAPTIYQPHCYRPSLHRPWTPAESIDDNRWVSDFVFVGTAYPSRVEFLERLVEQLPGRDVLLAGNWSQVPEGSPLLKYVATDLDECLDNADTVNLYRCSSMGLNLYRQEAQRPGLSQGWAIGPREVEMAACGLPFVRDPRGEGDKLFHQLPTFSSPGEAAGIISWHLDRPEVRRELGRFAQKAIMDRTFKEAAVRLLSMIEKG